MGLEGKTVLVTRAPAQSRELRKLLGDHGAKAITIPTITIGPPDTWDPADASIKRLADFDWIIFMSANAVDAFLDRAGTMPASKIAAVGSQTARRLHEREIEVHLLPEDFRAYVLIRRSEERIST